MVSITYSKKDKIYTVKGIRGKKKPFRFSTVSGAINLIKAELSLQR